MPSKHKIKRIEKVVAGWTRKSHKDAKIYFPEKQLEKKRLKKLLTHF